MVGLSAIASCGRIHHQVSALTRTHVIVMKLGRGRRRNSLREVIQYTNLMQYATGQDLSISTWQGQWPASIYLEILSHNKSRSNTCRTDDPIVLHGSFRMLTRCNLSAPHFLLNRRVMTLNKHNDRSGSMITTVVC